MSYFTFMFYMSDELMINNKKSETKKSPLKEQIWINGFSMIMIVLIRIKWKYKYSQNATKELNYELLNEITLQSNIFCGKKNREHES